MIRYESVKPNGMTLLRLNELTRLWIEENCSYGIVAEESEDWGDVVILALDEDEIIGYIAGHYYQKEKNTSYMEAGTRCFDVEGVYVLPQYRSGGIGRELYRRMERAVRGQAAFVTLSTSTKDYHRILRFYVEELGMTFHSAFLFKNLEEPVCE